MSAGNNDELLTNEAAQAAATAPGVEAVSEMRSGEAKVDGKTVVVTGVDANLTKVDQHHLGERLQQRPRRSSAATAPSSSSATPTTTRLPSGRP